MPGLGTFRQSMMSHPCLMTYEGVEFATRMGLQLLKCKDTNWYTIANENPRYCGSGFVAKRCEYDDLYGNDSYGNALIAILHIRLEQQIHTQLHWIYVMIR